MPTNGQLTVSVYEAAFSLGVSVRTIRRLISTNELRAVRIGRRVRVARPELDRFIEIHQTVTKALRKAEKSV